MALHLAFDVYGTLVDPMGMADLLKPDAGDQSSAVAGLWRSKQLEFSFRMGLMKTGEDFGTCTRRALRFAMAFKQLPLSPGREDELMADYLQLPAFTDAEPALRELKETYPLFAFSNGSYPALEKVLGHNGLLEHFRDLVSVDDIRSFKPDPAVYAHARRATGAWDQPLCLVSSNAWDVIGARSAGLMAIWVCREEGKVFEDWGVEPTAVVGGLEALSDVLGQLAGSN